MTHETCDGTGMAAASGRQRSPLRRILSGMVRARERQAARIVQARLLTLDDATLAIYGIDRAALHRDFSAGTPV
jgi:hypothetical protein